MDVPKNNSGESVSDQEELKGIAVDFYKNLFTKEDLTPTAIPLPNRFQNVCSSQASNMAKLVDKEEVRIALFDVGPYKAPGTDGFQAVFFQHQWNLVDNLVVNFIVEEWSRICNWAEINKTLLVLIPKVK